MRSSPYVASTLLFAALGATAVTTGIVLLDACGLEVPLLGWRRSFCQEPQTSPPPPPLSALDHEAARNAALQAEHEQLRRRLAMAPTCPEPPPPSPPAPPPPEPPKAEPPKAEPPKPPQPKPPQPKPEPPKPEPPKPERQAAVGPKCEVPRTERVTLLLDASSSMNWSYHLDPALDRRIAALNAQRRQSSGGGQIGGALGEVLGALLGGGGGNSGMAQEERRIMELIKATPGPSRIGVAKQALTNLVNSADRGVTFDFITFSECGPPRPEGSYGPDQRSALTGAITQAEPRSATALARALTTLPQIIPPSDKPINVVLVSDGFDSCGGDPCAAAAQIERARPEINVNVVAVSQAIPELRCISSATGGKFFQAESAQELAQTLKNAAGQQAPNCR